MWPMKKYVLHASVLFHSGNAFMIRLFRMINEEPAWIKDLSYNFTQKMMGSFYDAISKFGISKRGLTSIKYRGGAILVNGEENSSTCS